MKINFNFNKQLDFENYANFLVTFLNDCKYASQGIANHYFGIIPL